MRLSVMGWFLVLAFGFVGCGDDSPSDLPPADCDLAEEGCVPALCSNNIKDPVETDLDCGGICGPCELGQLCLRPDDCTSGFCLGLRCADPDAPQPECREHDECASRVCEDGMCQAPSCDDEVTNGNETGRDCGGSCGPCPVGNACVGDMDCQSGNCIQNVCRATRCGNGILDADEACDDGNLQDGDSCSADCKTVTCLVGGDLASLAAGLESSCSRITLGEGVFEGNVVVTRPVQIFGAGADKTVLQGDGSGPVIIARSAGVSLGYMSVEGGAANEGGGVFQDGGTLTLQHMQVTNNQATARGGGVFSQNGVLSILTTSITQNEVLTDITGCGGGLAVEGGSADVEDLLIAGNRVRSEVAGANLRGGGLCLDSMRLGAEKLRVEDNSLQLSFAQPETARLEGAGMWASNAETLIIGGSNWSGNSVDVSAPLADVQVRGVVMFVEGAPHILDTGDVSSTTVTLDVQTGTVEGGVIWTDATSWNVYSIGMNGLVVNGATTVRGGMIHTASSMDLNRVWMRNFDLGPAQVYGAGLFLVADARDVDVTLIAIELADGTIQDLEGAAVYASSLRGGTLTLSLTQSAVIRAANSGVILNALDAGDSVLCTVSNSSLGDMSAAAIGVEGDGSSVLRLFNATLADVEIGVRMNEQTLVQVANSIIDASIPCEINGGTMLSRGFNLYSSGGCVVTANDLEASTLLEPAAYADSDTQTFAPQMFSLAVNAGNPAGCAGPDGATLVVDQRDKPRSDARCDIGAHELP